MAFISVITPTYNRSNLLPQLVDCIKQQTYTDWELIIVDDGSTDNTEEVALSLESDTRIRYIKKDNSGAAHSRNVGVRVASGNYIVFLDSDDLVFETWLEQIADKLIQGDTDIVCVGVQFENIDGSIKIELPNPHSSLFPGTHFQLYAGAFAISKQLFSQLGGYDTSLSARQHTDLWIRIFNHLKTKSINIKCIYQPLVRIIEHNGTRIRKNPRAVYTAAIELLNKHKAIFANSKKALFNYYVIIGTNALGAGERKLGTKFLYKAFKLNPLHFKNNIRVIMSLFTFFGINSWEGKFKVK